MFHLVRIENARMNVPEPIVYEATASEAIAIGEALVLSAGKLTKCGATTAPEYIAMKSVAAADTDRRCPVFRVEPNQIFAVELSAAPTGLVVGAKVTLHTDGLKVTATTLGGSNNTEKIGVVTIVDLCDAAAAGDKILVRI